MLALVITSEDLARTERRFRDLVGAAGDLLPLMRNIGGYVRDAVRHRFEEQRTPEGRPWKPSLRAQLTGGVTLVDRGLLRDSYTDDAKSDRVEIGSNDPRARIHHHGGEITPRAARSLAFRLANGAFVSTRSVTMPARPALGLSGDDEDEVRQLTIEYLEAAAA